MADLARRQLRSKIPQLQLALEGHATDHHRFVLKQLMDHLLYLEEQIEEYTKRIEQVSRPFEQDIELLCQLPGYSRRSAENVIAEIGNDMNQFPSEHHLASWAGICPSNHESAGKRKQGTANKAVDGFDLLWFSRPGRLRERKALITRPNTGVWSDAGVRSAL